MGWLFTVLGYIALGAFIDMFITSDTYTKGTGEVHFLKKDERKNVRMWFWIIWIGFPIGFALLV